MKIFGVDFTSRPTPKKRITVARGELRGGVLSISGVGSLDTFEKFEALLREPGPWVGGFDFPFSMPREAVVDLKWPENWPDLMMHLRSLSRRELTAAFDGHREGRPMGNRYAHRRADLAARSSSSMKCVNPPVAWMMHEGAPRLRAADVSIPVLRPSESDRVALEAYPALVARMAIANASYKSDDTKKQTPERKERRAKIVDFVTSENGLEVIVNASPAVRRDLVDDGAADLLDAVLCAFQAAIAARRPDFGIPNDADPLEGWIALA